MATLESILQWLQPPLSSTVAYCYALHINTYIEYTPALVVEVFSCTMNAIGCLVSNASNKDLGGGTRYGLFHCFNATYMKTDTGSSL